MVDTRDYILEKARELFNQDGVERTSTRKIAEACNISQGNLTYHFPLKNDIVISLFKQLKTLSDQPIDSFIEYCSSFEQMRDALRSQYNLIYKYRFLFLDFPSILRQIKPLRDDYIELKRQRKVQFYAMIDMLQQKKLIAGNFSKQEKDAFYTIFNIFTNFWLPDSELLYTGKPEKMVDHYVQIALYMISLHLNKKGRMGLLGPNSPLLPG